MSNQKSRIEASRMMWNIYAMDMGYDDANTWSDEQMREWAIDEISSGFDINNLDGINCQMISWSQYWLDKNDNLDNF